MFAELLKYEVRHVDHVCLWLLINLVAKRNAVLTVYKVMENSDESCMDNCRDNVKCTHSVDRRFEKNT